MSGPKKKDKSIRSNQIIFFYVVSVSIKTGSRPSTESPNEQQRQENLPFNRKNLEEDQTNGVWGGGVFLLLMAGWAEKEERGEDR